MTKIGGDCFHINGMAIIDNNEFANAKLIHAVAVLRCPPYNEFVHCYLEVGERAVDFSNGKKVELPLDLYEAIGNVNQAKRIAYTKDEVIKMLLLHEHWGSWDKKLEGCL